MDLFPEFESDFRDVYDALKEKSEEIPNLHGEKKWDMIREAERELAEAEELLQTMSLGVKNVASGSQRDELTKRVHEYEEQLRDMQKEIKKAQIAYGSKDRERLFDGAHADLQVTADDDRARLLQTTTTMRRDTEVIQDAVRTSHRTIDMAADTMAELDDQTVTIRRGLDRLDHTNSMLDEANAVMKGMLRVAIQNKLLIALVCLIILGAIGVVLFIKLK
eukprot:CAMPEP_0177649664 /NCGR_PEP_ID=MMETSP0447-20121125/11516_1 /TAXON_ID=0 /ORGANISM="Stygamoeba regulata, Strain BSH-02190019" /LENGTH=219 /DNA_ID=CAMNT_0019152455 /DNA_START=201 /DNA_END=860 /DNA_ORIENTATION=-